MAVVAEFIEERLWYNPDRTYREHKCQCCGRDGKLNGEHEIVSGNVEQPDITIVHIYICKQCRDEGNGLPS